VPETIRAVVVDPSSPQGLAVKPVDLLPAGPDEVTVRVTAVSLNRGEVRRATSQGNLGDRPGWDFAGVVEERAANGSGPAAGSRVVGLLPSGAWAERVRAPSHAVAALPDAVTAHRPRRCRSPG
jgi:NADPH2:quinone reductase